MSEGLEAALVRAQANFEAVKKTKENKHYGSKYADLSDVLAAVLPALNAEGILFTQPIVDGNLITRVARAGETLESSIPLNLNVKPQELGSQLSYLRRYCASALLGVTSEDDDDGNAASSAKPRQRRTEPSVNDDGEPLATAEQKAQFTALCEAAELDRQDRADFVKQETGRTAWNQVTKVDAGKLIDALKGEQWVLTKGQDGKWFAFEKDAEPWSSGDEEDPESDPVGFPLTHDESGAPVPPKRNR